jgi:hypothetical protein
MNNHPAQDGAVICCIIGFLILCYLQPEIFIGVLAGGAFLCLPYSVGLIYQKIFKRKKR